MITKKEILKIFAYGGNLRNTIDKIMNAKRGALLVFVNDKKINKICVGGFKVNEDFSEEKIAELAKLDGAILVDKDLKKILSTNVLLHPSIKISTKETGTRHQAAERAAKQFNTLILAISEKAGTASLYYGNEKMRLSSLNELFTKAGEGIKVLEKNRELFKSIIKKIDTFEVLDIVTLDDIVSLFQRKKILDYISEILSIYLTELGKEGDLIELQLKEITNFINKEIDLIALDYKDYFDFNLINKELESLNYDEIIDKENLFRIFLSYKIKEDNLTPKGYRILKNIPILTDENIISLTSQFSDLKEMISSKEEELLNIKGINERKARAIKEYLLKI